jgi:uncharacterized repeat protein (TIGR02543 family)
MRVGLTLPGIDTVNDANSVKEPRVTTWVIALYRGTLQIGQINNIVVFSEPINSTVYFFNNGGTPIAPITQYSGTKINPAPTTTRTGYNFASWHLTPALANETLRTLGTSGDFVLTDNDITLYAKWTALEYDLTFSAGAGATMGDGTTAATATFGSAMPTAVKPQTAPTGKPNFAGYFTQADGAGIKYYNADMSSARVWDIAANTNLIAHWTA